MGLIHNFSKSPGTTRTCGLYPKICTRYRRRRSTNAASIAAEERQLLQQLLAMRTGLASMQSGHVKVKSPDGTELELMPIAVIDRRIAEVRARIVWFEQAAEGNDLPRAVYW